MQEYETEGRGMGIPRRARRGGRASPLGAMGKQVVGSKQVRRALDMFRKAKKVMDVPKYAGSTSPELTSATDKIKRGVQILKLLKVKFNGLDKCQKQFNGKWNNHRTSRTA